MSAACHVFYSGCKYMSSLANPCNHYIMQSQSQLDRTRCVIARIPDCLPFQKRCSHSQKIITYFIILHRSMIRPIFEISHLMIRSIWWYCQLHTITNIIQSKPIILRRSNFLFNKWYNPQLAITQWQRSWPIVSRSVVTKSLVSCPTRLSSSWWWRPQIAPFENCSIWEMLHLRNMRMNPDGFR